ncbi:MAG TPA: hypothetical protein VHB47_09855 [Thermoanaerobaculia bacterium]|jgi:hypothetical protein|nr:hypothetical protein [Thermoanaerobaculia bacterium]
MDRRRDGIGVVRAASVCLEGEDTVISLPVRQAATAARWLREAIQAVLWISLAMGFDAGRARSGDGDSDLAERQGTSGLRRDAREDGGEDTGEDSGGDSGEDTREEDKEERRRRRRRSTTTTTGRADEDLGPAGGSSRSGVDDDGEDGTPGTSVAESIAALCRGEVLAGSTAEMLTSRMSAAARADGPSLGARRIEALGAGPGESAVEHAAALGADAGDGAGERACTGGCAP